MKTTLKGIILGFVIAVILTMSGCSKNINKEAKMTVDGNVDNITVIGEQLKEEETVNSIQEAIEKALKD